MKKSDLMFLTFLRQDARQTLTTISRKTKIPISTLYDKLKNQERGLILKHTTLVDFSKLGYNCRAKIMLALPREQRDQLKNFLTEHASINSLYKINNGFDFMAEAVFEHVKELEEFVEVLESKFRILEKRVFYVIEDIKRECFLSRNDQSPLF